MDGSASAMNGDGSAMDGSASAMNGSASLDGLDGLGKGRLSGRAMNGSALHVDWTCINGVWLDASKGGVGWLVGGHIDMLSSR